MNRHALTVLEFPRVLDDVAARAISELGAEHVQALTPTTDVAWIEREHARIAAIRALREADPPLRPDPAPDLRPGLERLRVAGVSWNPGQMLQAGQLLRSARQTRDALSDEKRPAAARAMLAEFSGRLLVERALEASIDRCIADDATVKDEASPALRRLRRELRASEGELVRLLEKQLARLDEAFRVPDMSVTMRNGRYVIPVRREGRGAVSGIVHDVSASGATLFVEPPAAVEFGNRIRELEVEEREEVDRILAELTEELRPLRDQLRASLETLAELDSLHARAAYAMTHACVSPRFSRPAEGWVVHEGRHPLLLARGVPVVAFDLAMESSERTIVVSGPNTGGKTVLLKAVGLLSAMGQAGIPPTCGRGSRLAVFDNCFADIGDEQSIEASLSTFSAHLRNLGEVLASATPSSLVLIDELGSGTDPLDGASLGWAILEELTQRGTTTLASSHLGALKELATQVPGVVNASLQFDAERIAPTYRFVKGVPGRSYGISIARKLQLPESVVARAEERVPSTERDIAALLERLEQHEAELKQRDQELSVLTEDAKRRVQDVVRRERNVRDREREVERESRQEARKYLLNARADIERTLRDLRKAGADEIEERAREARQHAERLAARQAGVIEQLDAEEERAERRAAATVRHTEAPAEGDAVRVDTLGGKTGRLVELRGAEALVAVGSVKLTVPLARLEKVDRAELEQAVAWHGDLPDVHVRSEIDVRGLRADELDSTVLQALDDAIRADLPALRIIHGKGTGALRQRVSEMLSKDTRVKQFRLGAWNEGGAGVTIAELG
ncbi:MAG TPA: endonuclease MutS2 [Gemmatimonadaceae bacterium]|nr:endonuclease MutS2 [Gemmatimonadaceae bacterium]